MGPQTKATTWNAFFTFVLVAITACYAWFTWNMADTMTSQLELTREQHKINYRPYVFFEKFELDPKKFEGLQHMIIMKNSGMVPAKVKVEKYCFNNENNCAEINGYSYIFPNSDGTNIAAIGSSTEIKKVIENDGDFKLIIKLKYWSINDSEMLNPFIYESTIRIFVDPESPSNFLHENLYTTVN